MQTTLFQRSFSLISACCVAAAVWGASFAQAQEFKPFMTLQLAGPNALITIAEKFGDTIDPTGALGVKEGLKEAAPFKRLPGVDATGNIGVALQVNGNSEFGVDALIVLPIRDFNAFNLPIPEAAMMITMFKGGLKREGNKYTFENPFGSSIVFYQRTGFLVVATEGAAASAANVDPKKLFAELDKFTFGIHANLENISPEAIEAIMQPIMGLLALQGADIDFDPEELLEQFEKNFADFSSVTMGFTIDERTLNVSAAAQTVPKKGTEMAEKYQKMKNAKTKLGGFALDSPKTIFAVSMLEYMTNKELTELSTLWSPISEGFLEGLREAADEEGGDAVKILKVAETFAAWIEEQIEFYADNPLIDAAFSFDSDGTLLTAEATSDTDRIMKLYVELYNALPVLLGDKEGKAMQKFIDDKTKRDYTAVAGCSISSLPNLFAELPPGMIRDVVPQPIKDLPISVFWAVKKDEIAAFAVGLDSDKAEQALKAALEKTTTAVQPKQTAVLASKPLGEFLLNTYFPIMEKIVGEMVDEEMKNEVKKNTAILTNADTSFRIVMTTEYPGDAQLQKIMIDGKLISTLSTALLTPAVHAARAAAQRMQCMNNMKQIVLAFHNYHDTTNAFPPLYTVDANGKPLHSWRVLILPFIEQPALYQQIKLDEPWDSAHNKQFHNAVIHVYACSDNPLVKPGAACTYSVIAGEAFVPAAKAGDTRGRGLGEIVDGTSNTLAIVEVKQPFCWMDPTADITLDELAKGINVANGRVGSFHPGGCNTGFLDGACRFLSDGVDKAILRALGTIAGGEVVSLP